MTRAANYPKTLTKRLWQRFGDYAGLVAVLVLLVVIFSSQNPRFLSVKTVTSIVNQIPALTVVSVGMTLVLITGAIDLSVGSVLALASSVVGILMVNHHWSLPAAFIAAVGTGAFCGFVSGLITVGLNVPSFIVTLGILQIARGMAYLVTDSATCYVGPAVSAPTMHLPIIGISPAFLFALLVVLATQFALTRTVFGRYCIATGTNEATVRMSGIDSRPIRISCFVFSGMMAALAGFFETSRMQAADPNGAGGFELSAIAAAVIGGTSLMGGRGNVISTLFGVLIIAVLQTGLSQLGVDEGSKKVVTGIVIVLAVMIDGSRRWIGSRRRANSS